MNYGIFAAVCATVLLAGCATTESQTTAAAPAATPAKSAEQGASKVEELSGPVASRTESSKDAEDKVICRQITPTGSHRKKTICRTVKEIRQARDESQDALKSRQGPALQAPN